MQIKAVLKTPRVLRKGLKVRKIYADGSKSNIITVEEDVEQTSVYVEARPIKCIPCYFLDGEYVPTSNIEII